MQFIKLSQKQKCLEMKTWFEKNKNVFKSLWIRDGRYAESCTKSKMFSSF